MALTASVLNALVEYITSIVHAVAYGFYLLLAGISFRHLITQKRRDNARLILITYCVALFLLTTTHFVFSAATTESPGKIRGYDDETYGILRIVSDISANGVILVADSLIVYRAIVVCKACSARPVRMLVFLLLFMLLVTIVFGVLNVVESAPDATRANPETTTFSGDAYIAAGTVFFAVSVSLNVLSALAIASQLVAQRRRLKAAGLNGSHYIGILMVLAESAALYAVAGIVWIPFFNANDPRMSRYSSVPHAMLTMAGAISPNLIILRTHLVGSIADSVAPPLFWPHALDNNIIYDGDRLREHAADAMALSSVQVDKEVDIESQLSAEDKLQGIQ